LLADLGATYARQGNIGQAIQLLTEAARKNPRVAGAHYRLGAVLGMAQRTADAARCYRRAIALDPAHAEAHNNLANILQRMNRPDEAVVHYERALVHRPDYLEARYNLGRALIGLGRVEEALRHFDVVVALKPDFADAHACAASLHMWLGQLDEARRAIERAIDLAPDKPGFYRVLARLKTFTEDDPHIAALEALAGKVQSFTPDEESDFRFARAKGYDDLGQHGRAFVELVRANAIRRSQIAYDESKTLELSDGMRSLFSRDRISAHSVRPPRPENPIFIVGMPRSGSTLVEQILAGHPDLFCAGEIDEFARAVSAAIHPWGNLTDAARVFSESRLRRIGMRYAAKGLALAPPGKRLVDKALPNFLLAGFIHLVFPNARILHVRRDPLDTCFSCFSTAFDGDYPYAYDLAELGRYYRAYEAVMEHWRQVLPESVLLDVEYERLVEDFEPQTRRILAHCGLEWHEACRAFHQAGRVVRTASAVQVRQPLYRSSIGRARSYQALLKPLTDALRST
jgi:tetratricopeptide (TPR) repeat protein